MKCYCQTDSNCPVEHKCVPSVAFPQYKVCKADMSDKPDTLMPIVFGALAAGGGAAGLSNAASG